MRAFSLNKTFVFYWEQCETLLRDMKYQDFFAYSLQEFARSQKNANVIYTLCINTSNR